MGVEAMLVTVAEPVAVLLVAGVPEEPPTGRVSAAALGLWVGTEGWSCVPVPGWAVVIPGQPLPFLLVVTISRPGSVAGLHRLQLLVQPVVDHSLYG